MIAELPEAVRESGAIEVRKKLATISGGDVLDVGTDDGDFINVLIKTLKDYNSFTGIDISEKDLSKAKERFKTESVDFRVMNAESMEFKDNQFDTVCLSYTIHHLENIDTVLTEMYRVLKPGGHFIIQEMFSDGEQTVAQLVDRDVHHLDVKVDTLLGTPHFETLTRQHLRDIINNVGLSGIEEYESSWSVKCLFCEDVHDCQDAMRSEIISSVLKQIDDTIDKVREYSAFNELRTEANILKTRVKAEGSAAASVIYFFGKK